MLKNYITTAINNLLKNKLYSAINIIGLTVGLAACIIMSIYVQHELSYDRQWEKEDLIYRVNRMYKGADETPYTSALLLPALKKYFPQDIEFGTRIMNYNGEIQIGDKRYPAFNTLVDEDFIKIFQAEVLKGSLKSTLQSPDNIALSEQSAVQYFGDKDPIGEMITFDYNGPKVQYQVTAVYRFICSQTFLRIPCFSLLDEARLPERLRVWYTYPVDSTYVRLSETADIDKFVSRLPDFIDKTIDPYGFAVLKPGQKTSDVRGCSLQKMIDIYFNPIQLTLANQPGTGNRTMVALYTIVSVLVLIIGCINFVILTTAKATQRAREVAMRKVAGARFKQLFVQFLGESLLITFMAFLVAVAITEVALPFFATLMGLELTVPYTSPESYLFVLLLITLVGISGGLYPAFVLSRFSPAKVLKSNQSTDAVGSFKLRNVLVIFQFSASIVLIIATSVAFFQLLYTNKRDPGFNPENLFIVYIGNRDVNGHRNTFKEELLKLPEITNAALSSKDPTGNGWGWEWTIHSKKSDSNPQHQEIFLHETDVDYDFFNTYKIPLLSGRYFSREMDQSSPVPFPVGDPRNNNFPRMDVIINSDAARQLGYISADDAIGEIIIQGEQGIPGYFEFSIIGVVEDSQYGNLRVQTELAMYRLVPGRALCLTARYKGDYQKAVKEVERVWHEVVGDSPLQYSTVRQNMATVYTREITENMLFIAFALLSVFIACMGLFGMASFTVDRRVKEIGVRKVMGAKVKDIVKLLGWNFLKPVLFANLIAWPVAIFAMQNWLERFPYRFNPLFMIPICLGSGFIALVIAWFTVAGNTTRVARSKPIKALRYE